MLFDYQNFNITIKMEFRKVQMESRKAFQDPILCTTISEKYRQFILAWNKYVCGECQKIVKFQKSCINSMELLRIFSCNYIDWKQCC